MQKFGYLGCKIRNEQSCRFAYVDPIICMLCRTLGYEVELEDKMEKCNLKWHRLIRVVKWSC